MTSIVDNSYQLGYFRDNDDSLRRLKAQASIVLDQEIAHLRAAGLADHQHVLDIGCGPGIISSAIAMRTTPRRLVAGDVNDISIAETRRQFDTNGIANAEVKQLNVYDESIAELGKFDFVYSRLLFQHLSDPIRAMANVRASLADQGRFCICDIDDNWLSIAPATPAFEAFIARAGQAQAQRGGDRHVGSKLASYMKQSGFADIQSSVLMVTTDMIGKDAFCDLVFGYKLECIPDAELATAREELDRIREHIFAPEGWAAVGVFFVSGQRAGTAAPGA
ncbi:class I SAM-dependent methyltransferase [Massilia sp. PAMC28688]|uniref:class I SAM-dependent methyltransferase n=1 Tax=Massilia sp. PAMC28688 TaxID=2861283 RepID=UPI001C63353C|nr:class I SAM-dependent methyltransferase [Massilia sp. PAMC28688]QYF92628.1 class I SAM-dependent methyltransferase [Massilia sp. PAMC28688]